MPPYLYRVTVAWGSPNWKLLLSLIFGEAQHVYSQTDDQSASEVYGFDTPQTPADLGPLVRVELISE